MICAASVLTGCADSTGAEPPVRSDLPPSLVTPCAAPVGLPERALSDQEVEVLWGRDRSALRACTSRHTGLVKSINTKG